MRYNAFKIGKIHFMIKKCDKNLEFKKLVAKFAILESQ
jgi:hypothetical protein